MRLRRSTGKSHLCDYGAERVKTFYAMFENWDYSVEYKIEQLTVELNTIKDKTNKGIIF